MTAAARCPRVILIGSGAVRPVPGRDGPCQVVIAADGTPLLFDVGRGAATGLRRAGVPPETVSRLFLTHLHMDHVSDLPYFVVVTWVIGRTETLRVTGPVGTAHFVHNVLRVAHREDITSRFSHGKESFGLDPEVVEIAREGERFAEGAFEIATRFVEHGRMPNVAYRVETGGKSVVVLGDTHRGQDLAAFCAGADVLLVECSGTEAFLRKRPWGAWHMTPESVAALCREAGVRRVVLKHFVMEDEAAIAQMGEQVRAGCDAEVFIGADGLEIPVGETK